MSRQKSLENMTTEELQQLKNKLEEEAKRSQLLSEIESLKRAVEGDWSISRLLMYKDEIVAVESLMTNGEVGFRDCEGNFVSWDFVGDSRELTIKDITKMMRDSDKFLSVWLRCDDERVINTYNLEQNYKFLDAIKDLNNVINMTLEEKKELFRDVRKENIEQFYVKLLDFIREGKVDSKSEVNRIYNVFFRDVLSRNEYLSRIGW